MKGGYPALDAGDNSIAIAPIELSLASPNSCWTHYSRLSMDVLLILLLLAALAFWWYSASSRETATRFAREACRRCGVQLLDETVTMTRLRPQRSERGHMSIARWYTFEFSTSGQDRRSGVVSLIGNKLLDMHLEVDVDELKH